MSHKFLNSQILVEAGNKMLSMVSQKFEQIEGGQFPVVPNVKPGFLREQLPKHPPLNPESIEDILKDTENQIFPGLTLWSHPKFFAYYPSNITHASVIAEIFASAFGTPGFQWVCSPAQTELENIVCDWMVEGLGLPQKYFIKNSGGGTIASTVSDAIFISIHAAKRRKMSQLGISTDSPLVTKFVGYYGECAHVCSLKGLFLKDIHYKRAVPVRFDDESKNYVIDAAKAEQMIQNDIENGLIPFWFGASFGTTATCAYDPIEPIGQLCQKYKLWFNIDAAYAGSSWVIPEYRNKVKGLELADSIQVNFAKLMMCGLHGSLFYVSEKQELAEAMGNKIDFEVYKNKFTENYDVWDYKDWQVALGKRFNSLKLWWMIRSTGIQGMRDQILEKVKVASHFANLVRNSKLFKLFTGPELTLVTFQLINEDQVKQNQLNKQLYQLINEQTETGFISAAEVQGQYFLRVSVANHTTTEAHVEQFYNHIVTLSEKLEK